MSDPFDLLDRDEYLQLLARLVRAGAPGLTYYGPSSVTLGLLQGPATLAEGGDRIEERLMERHFLAPSRGDNLTVAAGERGASRDRDRYAAVLVVIAPEKTTATALAHFSGSQDDITVADGSKFGVAASIRIRSADGITSEAATIASKPSANVLRVGTLTNYAAYSADIGAGDPVGVLYRATVPVNSPIETEGGVTFVTQAAVTTGEANPIMDGESGALSLADKVWAEATTPGAAGNIAIGTVKGLNPAITGVRVVFNPEKGQGGADEQSDNDLKDYAIHGPAGYGQQTLAWYEAIGRIGNRYLLRVLSSRSDILRAITLEVVRVNLGAFTSTELAALGAYLTDRVKDGITVSCENATFTAVEVDASIYKASGATLAGIGKAYSDAVGRWIDPRAWTRGEAVDNSLLLTMLRATAGVRAVVTSTFSPAAPVEVASNSLPRLVRITLTDQDTGQVWNGELTQSYG